MRVALSGVHGQYRCLPSTFWLPNSQYDFSKLKEIRNPCAGKKKAVGIHLSPEVVDYSEGLADEAGLPCQRLVEQYLLD